MRSLQKTTLWLTAFTFILVSGLPALTQAQDIQVPVIEDGQAQVIPEFEDPENWIRHDLWVETEFDSDGNGKPDRVHVAVTRPQQTESGDLKLPVIYESSPYYAGTAPPPFDFFWNVKHEIGEEPPARKAGPDVDRRGERPIISNSQIKTWVPRRIHRGSLQFSGNGTFIGFPNGRW
ncbi:MAG: hypothetical protein U5K71_03480 [Gracilimonas sp.]|nr:hypothetical protein [Gracilimonas sp.]